MDMNWDRIEGNWKQFQGKVKQQWGKLTDGDMRVISGKRDLDACKAMRENQKDICVETAKGKEKVAKAENEAAYKDTEKAHYDARVARAEADYAVAKEK